MGLSVLARLLSLAVLASAGLAPKRSMLWLSPPAWDNSTGAANATQMNAIRAGLKQHRDAITVIGTIGYSIDPAAAGWWGENNPGVRAFNAEMKENGFGVHPLIGGLRPDTVAALCGNSTSADQCQIEHFRKIWAEPTSFIERAVQLIRQGGWDGVNIDFESGAGSAVDDLKFAAFLRRLSTEVHKVGARVSVDTNWGEYLNPGVLADTGVDTVCDMQTYGLHDTDFMNDLKRDANLTTIERYGMGICPVCCNPCIDIDFKPPREVRWHTANITKRFGFAQAAGVREVDIWANLDIGATCADSEDSCWWRQIAAWLKQP